MTPPRSVEEWVEELDVVVNRYHTLSFADPPSYHTQLEECEMCQEKRQKLVAEALRAFAAEQVARARAEEREACAKFIEEAGILPFRREIAAALRARP